MLHELRTYTIQPAKFAQYLQLTARVGISLRTKHSKLLGYWTTETGELNQVVHLWEYNDHDHRARVRAALAKDRAWQTRYVARVRPMLQRQHAWILTPLDVWPFTPPTEPGIYELRDYRLEHV